MAFAAGPRRIIVLPAIIAGWADLPVLGCYLSWFLSPFVLLGVFLLGKPRAPADLKLQGSLAKVPFSVSVYVESVFNF